ncbi:MAG: hypothetical protein HN998_01535 [Candidatus Thioglobus sp.]|jgi:ElaB/YqjD/DUF883 family membrane-anchored ribosome-binding protein|nr:hypothetical protein [Candidatus Thioglobus sp.]
MKEKYQHFLIQIKSLESHWQQLKKDIENVLEGWIVFSKDKANNIFQKVEIAKNSVFDKVTLAKSLSKEWHEITKKTSTEVVKNIHRVKNKNIKTWNKGWGALSDLRNKIAFIGLGAFLSIALTSIANEGANPFDPIFNASSGSSATDYIDGDSSVHPLQQQAVKKYTLMALIASKKGDIAMVRAKNGEEFFVRLNDTLGDADGKVTGINKRGIEITEKDKIISLLVRNRSVRNDKN